MSFDTSEQLEILPLSGKREAPRPRFASYVLDSCGSRGLFRRHAREPHRVFLSIAIYCHMIAREHRALQNLQRQRILNQPLDCPPQRPCSIRGIVTFAEKKLLRCGRQFNRDLAFREQLLDILQQQVNDFP